MTIAIWFSLCLVAGGLGYYAGGKLGVVAVILGELAVSILNYGGGL